MRFRAEITAIGLGVLAACGQTANDPQQPAAEEHMASPETPADPAFADALTFDCGGGGRVDVVLDGPAGGALARLDGGAGVQLRADETVQTGPGYTDGATTIVFEGNGLTYRSGDVNRRCAFVPRDLSAPTVEGVAQNLTEADAGATVRIKVGEKISVSLSGVPTAGYIWAAEAPPAFITVSEGPGGPTSSAQRLPGFAGGSHWEVLVIRTTAPGEGQINLVQKRPWDEQASPDDKRFSFQLEAE